MYAAAIPTPSTPPASSTGAPSAARASRRARLGALALDLAVGLAFQAATLAAAFLLFVLRTGGGARDLQTAEATLGWAIALAAVPAWLGLLVHSALLRGATPGQRAAGLAVEGSPPRRVLRLAGHPVGVIAWAWLAIIAFLAAVPGGPLLLLAAAMTALTAGVISGVMLLARPGTALLHDHMAGTRLVTR